MNICRGLELRAWYGVSYSTSSVLSLHLLPCSPVNMLAIIMSVDVSVVAEIAGRDQKECRDRG